MESDVWFVYKIIAISPLIHIPPSTLPPLLLTLILFCFAELLNVFETFLPQLLMYPNPTDPLNAEAASMLMNTPNDYKTRVRGKTLAGFF